MTTQAFLKSSTKFELMLALASSNSLEEPIYACSCDYGFDYHEAALAEELDASLSESLASQAESDISAADIESSQLYYFS